MKQQTGTCPLTRGQIADEYFTESRNRLLELAAFLDRLERAAPGGAEHDFRVQSLRDCLPLLDDGEPARVRRIQMRLSDTDLELRPTLDRKSATGAPNPELGENG